MRTLTLALFAVLGVAALPTHADSWFLPPEVKDTNYVFGATQITLRYDSLHNSLYPEYTLIIKNRGATNAVHKGIGFEQVFASPDNAYFLGVSNSGLIKDAYVVFDAKGKLLKRQPHDPSKIHYDGFSISLIRHWYDAANPAPQFGITNGILHDVTIHGCEGKIVSLLAPMTAGAAKPQ